MSSSSYRAAVERLSAQLDQIRFQFTASAIPPAQATHSAVAPFPSSHTLHSSRPNRTFFVASMGFQSEVDDVEALDKILEKVSDKRFSLPAVRAGVESALSHQHESPSQQHASTSSRSPPSSVAPSASQSRTPKRPRTNAVSLSRSSRVEDSIPAPSFSVSVKKKNRNGKPKSRSSASDSRVSIKLKLRVKAPDENELPHDQQPSQSSYHAKQGNRYAHQSLRDPHHELDAQPDSSDVPRVSRKSRQTSKRRRRSRNSRYDVHDENDHSTHERISTQEPSRESTPLRVTATKKVRLGKEKRLKRRIPSASNGSFAQSGDDSEPLQDRSDDSDLHRPKHVSRKRRKISTAEEDSENGGPISEEPRIITKPLTADSSPDIKDRISDEREIEANVSAIPKSQPHEASKVTHLPDPLASLLSFARKSGPLSSLEGMSKRDIIKCRQSLATIPGCEQFVDFNLFRYCRALCHYQKQALESMKVCYDGRILKGKHFDALSYDIDDHIWQDWLVKDGHHDGACPPGLPKMFDTIQFVRRLLEVISDSDDDIAESFMERWYDEGLTVEIANLTLNVIQFWYQAAREKAESEDNYSELLDWAIRLAISIVIYELSPLSFISRMKNLSANNLFITSLNSSTPDDHSVSFEKLLSFSMEFLQGCPSSLGKECRKSVSELMQVFLLRNGIPWDNGSPQHEHWQRIHKGSLTLPQTLCQQEFFWSNPFSKALQQVRREPLAGDTCFDIGFLVNIVSSPLFMRELLQNQSKCLGLLCDVMTKSLEVLSRDPLTSFRTILIERKNFPSVPTLLDLIQTLMSSAVMQRELLATEVKIKDLFLDSVNLLLLRSARMGSNERFQEKLETLAENGLLCNREMDLIVDEPVSSNAIDEEKVMTRQRILAFNAILLASMGKSLEDGSRDMSQMNALKAFLRSKAGSTRNRRRTWEVVLRIQGGLDDHYIDSGVKQKVLSPQERNHFSMVVEAVRKHFQKYSTENSKTPCSVDEKSSSSMEVMLPRKRISTISFPPVTTNFSLRHAASQRTGYFDFDTDPDLLRLVQTVTKEEAQQTLARFDPESEFAWKWVRLQRKNAYVGGARDLLEKNDRALGQKCTCLPGVAKEKRDGSGNRVACSNGLCENRHLRIECVPGECGAGSYCQNQRLQRLEYAKFKKVSFPNKGVGLVADEDIRTGDLIGEYQGEVISMETFRERMREYQGERHFYFMTLTSKLVIDASRKSQATRFLNHSCDPNAETQKWNAGGEPRVGIYAIRDIAKGEEITFDYGARSIENGSAPCVCGSSKCRGKLTSMQGELSCRILSSKTPKPGENREEETPDLERNPVVVGEQSELDVEKIVQAKISNAKSDLRRALELGRLAEEKAKERNSFEEVQLSPGAEERLRMWRETINRRSQSKGPTPRMEDEVDTTVRIPRRNKFTTAAAIDGQTVSNTWDDHKKRSDSYPESAKDIETKSMTAGTLLSMPRVPRRSSVIADLRPRVPLSKPSGNAGIPQKFSQSSLEKNADSERPLSRAALIGREKGFQPSMRHTRKPLKPKVKQRMKTRKDGSDNDSMGEYSTASEAEPVMDEEPFSPSQLPDGRGARSDDEFVAESPLDALHIHREGRKARDNHEHPKQDDVSQRRREKRESGAVPKHFTADNPRGGPEHSLEGIPRPPHFSSQEIDRGILPGGKADQFRPSHGLNAIRSSEFAAPDSRELHANCARVGPRVGPREAHENRTPNLGNEARGNRMSQRPWLNDRPPRETEYHDRNLHFSNDPFRRNSPRFPRERDSIRDFSRNRSERPRFSDGGRNEPFPRQERYLSRDRSYSQGYGENRYRERQRWAEAIREEPLRGRDVGKRLSDFERTRPSNDIPPQNRDHPLRDWPPRDRPRRDHLPRDHPPRDHPPRDHPPRDHPPRDHPPRDHPLRSMQKETGSRLTEKEPVAIDGQLGQKRDRAFEDANEGRGPVKAQSIGDKPTQHASVAKENRSAECDQYQRERLVSRFSQTPAKRETPAKASVDARANINAVGASDSKTAAASQTIVDSRCDSKAVRELEEPRKGNDGAVQKGSDRTHDMAAPRSSFGASSQDRSHAAAEKAKSTGFEQSLEVVDTPPKSDQVTKEATESGGIDALRNERNQPLQKGPDVKTGETMAKKMTLQTQNEEQDIPKRSFGREEMRRSRFQADELRFGSNKRVGREGDSNEKVGLGQTKRRRKDSDDRLAGVEGKRSGGMVGRGGHVGSHAGREGFEHERRDKWKGLDSQHGYEEGGFRRRGSEGRREERKRFRHRSPTRGGPKRKKKSGRDGARASGVGDKSREEGRRNQVSAQVVRGSTRQDLRSLLSKGRAGE
eukprot:TRINITY_DN841_c0_g1_i4.p1 TRINITY_DN841_c0_g1~~TRINITY_DN841_c0_g1_i4.p1  ORF type:complete len:2328 (+),score=285.13 TRINITY_DN841_c0_g1_i4:7792-14775(+)